MFSWCSKNAKSRGGRVNFSKNLFGTLTVAYLHLHPKYNLNWTKIIEIIYGGGRGENLNFKNLSVRLRHHGYIAKYHVNLTKKVLACRLQTDTLKFFAL